MPRLQYSLAGDNQSFLQSIEQSISAVGKLEQAVNNIKFSGPSEKIKTVTSAVSDLNSGLLTVSRSAKQSTQDLQDIAGVKALDDLARKLLVIQGNAALFGDSIKNQTAELGAYQSALNKLLEAGIDPLNGDVTALKTKIDSLTESLQAASNVKPIRNTVFEGSNQPSAENLPRDVSGSVGNESQLVATLNQQLAEGAITAEEYSAALAGANSTASKLGETTQQTSAAIEQQDGYLAGLKQSLAQLNEQRIIAPYQDLAALNAEIQQTETAIKQAGNVGKQGFDDLGNSIRGVRFDSATGQLINLQNNLFGARQIAKDFSRAIVEAPASIEGFARSVSALAVDFLFYAQNAQFSVAATGTASAAIATEGAVAGGAALSVSGLGAAFTSLLNPTTAIVLVVAVLAGSFVAYEKSQKNASKAATEHLKALRDQKQALDDVVSTLSLQAQVQAKAADSYSEQIAKLGELYTALQDQIKIGKDYTQQIADLQNAFPQFFANIDKTTAKTNELTAAYKNAGEAIRALGAVTAANQLAGESNVSAVKNQVAANDLLPQLAAYRTALAAAQANTQSANLGVGSGQGSTAQAAGLERAIAGILDQIKKYNGAVAEAKTKTQQFYEIAAQNQQVADKNKNVGIINGLEQQLKTLKAVQPYITDQVKREKNIADQKAIQAQLDELLGKNVLSRNKAANEYASILQQISDILSRSSGAADKSGLTGYAKQVASINTEYEGLYTSLQKVNTKIDEQVKLFALTNGKSGLSNSQATNARGKVAAGFSVLNDNQAKQLSDAAIKEAQDTATAIQKINDEFGIKQQLGYNAELARIKKLYDDEISEAKKNSSSLDKIEQDYQRDLQKAGNNPQLIADAKSLHDARVIQAKDAQDKITAINAALLPSIQNIDAKYIDQIEQTYAKITDIANQAFTALDDGEEKRTDKINAEYKKRENAAAASFDKLRELAKASNLGDTAIAAINSQQSQVSSLLQSANFKEVSRELSKDFADAMQGAIRSFASDFYGALTSLGETRDQIDQKYAQQLSAQQAAYANGTSNITAEQNQATVNQINQLKKLELQSTTSFGAIFSTLVTGFQKSFNQSILQSFSKKLTENLGSTLIKPSLKDLTISPEETAAQNVATSLSTAGSSLAAKITQAGIDFANSILGGSTEAAATTTTTAITAGTTTTTGAESAAAALVSGGQEAGAALKTGAAGSGTSGGLSSSTAGLLAAGALAGGLISGSTSKTSTVGQGLGGALTGAASGALIGTAFGPEGTLIGGAIGGLVGLVGGIFGASKARKALQEQQLEQQKEQTALLKASLAYTSSIIGRDTANGIVTDVSVGAFGQLVATVSGKDLQFVLDRTANGR